MPERSIQDSIGDQNGCWGCGPSNTHGLRIKSYWERDEGVCRFIPAAWHNAGPPDLVNGGILASIIDCHAVCFAIADCYRMEGRAIGSEPLIWCATGNLEVSYLRPTPLGPELTVRALVSERAGRKTMLDCGVWAEGVECARGRVVAVRVPSEWRHGGERRSTG